MSTEPFLIAFFLIYVIASLLFAMRHSLFPKQAVDATLIFGTPLVVFSLQVSLVKNIEYATAFSSLVIGVFYLLLRGWIIKQEARTNDDIRRWLAESFMVLGVAFITLAIPLALDARWTSAAWALEGVGIYWMGQRQSRWLARASGLGLQLFAAISYLNTLHQVQSAHWPLANPAFIGASLLAVSALSLAWWSRSSAELPEAFLIRQFMLFEKIFSPILFWIGFLWWQFALGQEINRSALNFQNHLAPVFEPAMQLHLYLLAWLGSAFVAHYFASSNRASPWPIAATPAWFALPVMFLIALNSIAQLNHVFQSGGWLVWPIALFLHGIMLRRLDAGAPQTWWRWVHAGGVWLFALLVGNLLIWIIHQSQLQGANWESATLLVLVASLLLILSRAVWFDAASVARASWPLDRFSHAYLWRAAALLAFLVIFGCLSVAVHSNGDALPLAYIPLLNPTDLSIALGLFACALWLKRLRQSTLKISTLIHHHYSLIALAAIAFLAINTVWLRVVHQFADVPWNAVSLFDSFLVQAGYSILWTLIALSLMLLAQKRQARNFWMSGAVLLGLTVLKLFLIDLSNHDGSERIIVFIAVGVLMLLVGYFAPIPPSDAEEKKRVLV